MIIDKETERFLTVSEVSDLLHVHPNTLKRWTNNGKLTAYRFNRRRDRMYKLSDVNAFLNQLNQSR